LSVQGNERAAIIGAGPSGFYAAEQLLTAGFTVDLLEMLPTPFGLVRAGVAPDHPKIKSVTRVYSKIAQRAGFRFFGGIELGRHITRKELLARYHAVVYAIGTAADNRLGIPGEELAGCHGATEFVSWYNGHPAYAERTFDLSARRAVIIGNGNVAIDVARMLMLSPQELALTDTADHAITALARSQLQEVVLLGRRGPAQASFTNPELLELGEMRRAETLLDPCELELDAHSSAWLGSDDAGRTARRNMEILKAYADRPPAGRSHRIVLRFMRSPVAILGDHTGRVVGLRVMHNRIDRTPHGTLRAVATGEQETITCGLVLRSIGYRGEPPAGIPSDPRTGLILNREGRVADAEGRPQRGEYTTGWIKRGPSGVIGTNKKCSAETVGLICADRSAGSLNQPSNPEPAAVEAWLRRSAGRLVTWSGWSAIDTHELTAGERRGRPRVKLVSIPAMHEVAAADTRPTRQTPLVATAQRR
jgi:ferredoxin--NADP+ reductase